MKVTGRQLSTDASTVLGDWEDSVDFLAVQNRPMVKPRDTLTKMEYLEVLSVFVPWLTLNYLIVRNINTSGARQPDTRKGST